MIILLIMTIICDDTLTRIPEYTIQIYATHDKHYIERTKNKETRLFQLQISPVALEKTDISTHGESLLEQTRLVLSCDPVTWLFGCI